MFLVLMGYPILASIVLFVFKSSWLNKAVTVLYSVIYLGFVTAFHWITPQELAPYFGIDPVNLLFMTITAILYCAVSFYNLTYFDGSEVPVGKQTNYYISLMLFIFAMNGFMLSQHLGLNWVFIEATTLATAYLIYFDRTDEALTAAWKYLFICTIGISLAFVGIIFISKGVGGNMDELFYSNLYLKAKSINGFWIDIGFLFIILGFGTKMGLAPLHSWLPDAHSEAPSPMSALLSGTLLNLAFLGILRVYKIHLAAGDLFFASGILLVMGFASLVFSAAFILRVDNYKKMLAYSSIEHMGIIAIGVATGGLALLASFIHLAGHSLSKAAFFLTSGNILHRHGTKQSAKIKGLLRTDPKTGTIWLLCFLCIAGFPPFPLFFSEFMIVRELIAKGEFLQTALFLLLLTVLLLGLARTVFAMLLGEADEPRFGPLRSPFFFGPQLALIVLLLLFGISIPPAVMELFQGAAAYFQRV